MKRDNSALLRQSASTIMQRPVRTTIAGHAVRYSDRHTDDRPRD